MISKNSRKLAELNDAGSKLVARRRFNFTKRTLDSLPNPSNGQRAYFYDTRVRGLTIAISPTGRKNFVLYRKVAGRPERITIGLYPDLSIEQARDKAEELNAAIARGENPGQNRRTVRAEHTLGDLFNIYLEHHAKPHKKSWANDIGMFNKHFASWRLKKISTIRKMDAVSLHAHIGRVCGHYAGNRAMDLLSTMFSKAIEWGWQGENPAHGVKAFREKNRDRFLQPEELPFFFQALGKEPNGTLRDYFAILLMTGARRSNVQEMQWAEINWHQNAWRIPETKNGEMQDVPLSPAAVRILEQRKSAAEGQWVFPGLGKTGHLVEPKTAWRRVLAQAAELQKSEWLKAHPNEGDADFRRENPNAGFRDLRIHDLRRTLGSWQAATGASLPIIGKSLGHKSLTATQIYARLNLDPVRESVNKATDAMLLAGGVVGLLQEEGPLK